MKITSLANEKVGFWAKLKMKKYRDIENLFIVEGEHLVEEAIKKGIVKEIITTKSNYNSSFPVYEVTTEIMDRITSLVSSPGIMAICHFMMPDDIKGNILLLDSLQDPGNLGTIIRSAVAFNFNTIIVSPDTVDCYNDKVIRSSEGMIFNVNIIKSDLFDIIPLLKEKGYCIIGTDVRNGHDIKSIKKNNIAIIIGNEGKGMNSLLKEYCDDYIYININKNCESLNAGVAASIIMYGVNNE